MVFFILKNPMNVVECFVLAIGEGTIITKAIVANALISDHQNYVHFHRDLMSIPPTKS
jgi:hypothetical protein